MSRSSAAHAAEPASWAKPTLGFTLYHGPDRIPVPPAAEARKAPVEGEPFHGIISRGLAGDDTFAGVWADHAHRLFDGEPSDDPALLDLREAVRRLHVLSFRQSAEAAERYLAAHLPPKGRRLCDLWNIKEGHTSSVWQVTAHDEDGFESFILNVARDDEAGEELARAAATMQALGARHPGLNMARLEDCASVEIDYFGEPHGVVVTRNELIRDALEIHLGRHRQTGEPTYVVVERFLTEPSRPAEIAHLVGRVMTNAEWLQLEADLDSFLEAAGAFGPVAVDINHGDLVWDGSRAVVVAIR